MCNNCSNLRKTKRNTKGKVFSGTFKLNSTEVLTSKTLIEVLTSKALIDSVISHGDSRYIYQIELEKACFQHDMAYGDFIYLTRITASDKILRDKAFNIAKNPKKDGYQRGLVSIVYKFFDKKASGSGSKNKNILNKELAEELHKPIIRKCKKGKEHSLFTGNIWHADIADMQLTRKFDKGICFLLHVIDIFSKYAWAIPLIDKKGITITNAFQNLLKECNRKSNKIWVDKRSEFYNRSVKSWLEKNDIEMYSTHNEEKSVLAERLTIILRE